MKTEWTQFRIKMAERIDSGIQHLSIHYPDWLSRVDIHELDEGDLRKSVYAQVTGEIFTQTDLGRKPWEAEDLGMFLRPTQCPDNMLGMGYKILTDIWRKKIKELRDLTPA